MKKKNDTTTKGELLQDKWKVVNDVLGNIIICNKEGEICRLHDATFHSVSNHGFTDAEIKANAELICQAVNERQKLLDENTELKKQVKDLSDSAIIDEAFNPYKEKNKKLLDALKKAHKQLHDMCNMYCRDKDGYLNHEPGGWDAELDIEIETIINQ